jgi:aspartyl-tRNA(Asn)/glutamyl-tRNA(Gln) amidotransferase subunit B
MNEYEPVIGLEIHAELLTQSKMFCGCRVVDSINALPNTAVCPICLGMPGMLPVINKRAIEYAIRVALVLNCTVQTNNIFARKNYFYPDLPKAYQISQYELPLATAGWLDFSLNGDTSHRIGITRVHMEEDTGKLTHLESDHGSLVDFNRSGVPLLEIVSEPDLRSVEETRLYALKMRQILRYLEVNSGDMEKGVIRFEANVSLRPKGSDILGTRTEIKNLNSFRSLADAIGFEIDRQASLLDRGEKVIQDTMGWNESRQMTFSQRGKEEAHDYRYFPEPDLPPLQISNEWIAKIKSTLPELPDEKIARYRAQLALSYYDAQVLTEERLVAEWFEQALVPGADPKSVANWMINVLFGLMNLNKVSIEQVRFSPSQFVDLIALIDRGAINVNGGKQVLAEMFDSGRDPEAIIEEQGLAQVRDDSVIREHVSSVLSQNPEQLAAYLGGKEQLKGWFMGQVMRESRGKADPSLVNKHLSQQLAKLSEDDIPEQINNS